MKPFDLNEVMVIVTGVLFALGLLTFGTGLYVLVVRAFNKDLRQIAKQTTILAQKGIAEEVAGLVGNVSMLVSALQGLTQTAAGIGIFLTLMGSILMTAAYFLLQQTAWPF